MSSDNNKINIELKKEDLEKLLSQELHSDIKVEKFSFTPLTKPGDNYGSTILAVEVFYYTHENSHLQKLPIVAKLVPESPFLRKVFNIEITFNKEVRAYTLVAPEFHKLQKEKGIPENEMLDVFPKYYGSRSNKQDDINKEADDSAVLLMENLKSSGYEIGDRRKGFNLEHMELVLSKLAQFHALGVALKLLKPQVFKDNILKTCENFEIGTPDDDEANDKFINATINHIKHIPEVIPYLDTIEKVVHAGTQMRKERRQYPIREPFSTIVHNDFWVNNMMFKYDIASSNTVEKKSCPTGIKFVDFQVTVHASPIKDLIFLLFSSSELGLLQEHYDRLIQHYHKEFTGLLTKLDCGTEMFSYEYFIEELNVCAPQEFFHILFMLNPISADPLDIEETSSMNQDSMLKNRGDKNYEKKVKYLVKKFASQGWL
ncbi:hypothetical protein L9F63_015448 [Diploptera punctata]|uniref:CHK kinase-like domain-containing protein n=1 Tax=Diploptera punctata TaxID=6984 RepID=A0AAD8EJG5_DIPPU|nr:hypothetical protein L9F63_015448 [Diploptera punctata]